MIQHDCSINRSLVHDIINVWAYWYKHEYPDQSLIVFFQACQGENLVLCMCVFMCVCMYACIVYLCMYLCMCVDMCIYIYVCMCVYMYVSMYVCTYVYICTVFL